MKISVSAALLLASVASAELLEIPQVSKAVKIAQSKYSQWLAPSRVPEPTRAPKKNFAHVVGANPTPTQDCSYWMETLATQGTAAYNPSPTSYQVFRNVMDYGAKGDGMTDDTAAINYAIYNQSRFGPASDQSSTNTPAVVYFPVGNYIISSPIVDYYYTQIIGNPNCLPVITPTKNFSGNFLIDGDQYGGFNPSTIIFYRQIRNFVINMTTLPSNASVAGINWRTAQATSLQNIEFLMSEAKNTAHMGVAMADGSGGFLTDLVFRGGKYGMMNGNQQFTMRNLTFRNVQTAIVQTFSWGWTYQGIHIMNCTTALDMTAVAVGAVTFIDSIITTAKTAFLTSRGPSSQYANGQLILENVVLNNVPAAVTDAGGKVVLEGTNSKQKTKTIAAWAQGTAYNSTGMHKKITGTIKPDPRPISLLKDGSYFTRSKPQYGTVPVSGFKSARDAGATGDGTTDDTIALQNAINEAISAGQVLFVDAGTYLVTKTILFPPGLRVVGESYSVIMSSGAYFNNYAHPQPVVRVGNKGGQSGRIEWSDMIVSTQGQQFGATLIEWNLISPTSNPSGMWDVHTRIGGADGTDLQIGDCPPQVSVVKQNNYNQNCVGGFLTMHVTKPVTGLYMENNWLWTADHDLDTNQTQNQITVYNARGFLCEAASGPIWMWGVAVEHHTMYQYQFVNTKNIFISQTQSETPYYQPNPPADIPFPAVKALSDPVFNTTVYTSPTTGTKIPNAEAWGLRVVDSGPIVIYGAGHYSFFKNYSTNCLGSHLLDIPKTGGCQSRIVSLESTTDTLPRVFIYDLHTVGTYVMLSSVLKGKTHDIATYIFNNDTFEDNLGVFKPTP